MRLPAAFLPLITLAIAVAQLSRCVQPPRETGHDSFAGSASCKACHAQESRYWAYGPHREIDCERCHGPGSGHARSTGPARAAMTLGDTGLCLACHARDGEDATGDIATIESFESHLRNLERDHRVTLDRQKSGTGCVYCHDPHLVE